MGATQWLAALARPPHLTTIVPNVTASNYHEGWTYQGGAFELGFNMSWTLGSLTLANLRTISSRKTIPPDGGQKLIQAVDSMETSFRSLPLREFPHLKDGLADYYYDWLAHPDYDDYWKQICIEENHSRLSVPAYNIGVVVRYFSGRDHTQLSGHEEGGGYRRGKERSKAAHWPVVARCERAPAWWGVTTSVWRRTPSR